MSNLSWILRWRWGKMKTKNPYLFKSIFIISKNSIFKISKNNIKKKRTFTNHYQTKTISPHRTYMHTLQKSHLHNFKNISFYTYPLQKTKTKQKKNLSLHFWSTSFSPAHDKSHMKGVAYFQISKKGNYSCNIMTKGIFVKNKSEMLYDELYWWFLNFLKHPIFYLSLTFQ